MSEWRERHNERITNFFYPDIYYNEQPVAYPAIIPYCAIPNYNCLFDYEIEDLIQKKYFYDLYKIILSNQGFFPKPNPGVGKGANKYSSFEIPFRKVNLASEIMKEIEYKHEMKQKQREDQRKRLKERELHSKVNKFFDKEKQKESLILPKIS
jgi:hypothetical protein